MASPKEAVVVHAVEHLVCCVDRVVGDVRDGDDFVPLEEIHQQKLNFVNV